MAHLMKSHSTILYIQKNWLLIISLSIIGINGFIFRGHELDDALIYARYIQNLISGNGLVYNTGEYVNGLTSPLFAYLSITPAWVMNDARQGTMLVSVLGFGMPGQLMTFGLYLIPALMFLLAAFSVRESSARQYLVLTSTFLALYTVFFAIFNIPSQWWYYAIYFTVFVTYLVISAHWLIHRFNLAAFSLLQYVSVIGLAVFLVWQQAENLNLHGRTVREDYREIGLWIAENTDVDASIARAEIGTVGWYSQRQVIDILG